MTLNKTMTIDDIVDQLSDGMTIGIGGWATRRKPMALVRAIARSGLKDLTVAAYGGPDFGLLAATGKVKKFIFAFASLDHIANEPHFKNARQAGTPVLELDEGMFHWGLRAAAMRMPFLPTRIGDGTSLLDQPELSKRVTSPFDDGEIFVAMPAIKLDAALLHVHRADQQGNTLTLSPDPFFDELMGRAADKVYVTTEKLVATADLDMINNLRFNILERAQITGVAEAPYGAHPTSAAPDYHLDLGHLKTYAASAATAEEWSDYRSKFLDVSEAGYLAAVGGPDQIAALKTPSY
jgi:glutaconate CoA-transferase, subunit A